MHASLRFQYQHYIYSATTDKVTSSFLFSSVSSWWVCVKDYYFASPSLCGSEGATDSVVK